MQHEECLMIAEVLIHHLDVMRFLCGELTVVGARATRTLPMCAAKRWRRSSWKRRPVRRWKCGDDGGTRAIRRAPRIGSTVVGRRRARRSTTGSSALLANVKGASATIAIQGYQASFDGVIAHFVDCLEHRRAIRNRPDGQSANASAVEDAYNAAGLRFRPRQRRGTVA
jgi:predicted dehydrogenase